MTKLPLLDRLASTLQALNLQGEILTVGFSGGRDSVALLALLHRLAPSLGFSLQALHVNHGLNPRAAEWAAFCQQFCADRAIPCRVISLSLTPVAGDSLEAVARAARYDAYLQAEGRYLVLAHHQDDQAETFLLQAMRGAGVAGLSGMPCLRSHGEKWLLRPLLDTPRIELEQFLSAEQLPWVEDDSNACQHYRRNALRHDILPRLAAVQPGVAATLARSAGWCAETLELLRDLACLDGEPTLARLAVADLARLSAARARNLLRVWLQERGCRMPSAGRLQEFLHQVISASDQRWPELLLPEGAVRRFAGELYWVTAWQPRVCEFVWQGESRMRLAGWCGELQFTPAEEGVDADLLASSTLRLQPRQGGELLQMASNRPRQRLKQLLQAAGIPPWERARWPLLYAGAELIAVPHIGVAASWQSRPGITLAWQPD